MTKKLNYPEITNDRYRLNYHIMAPSGWINDPNGFVFFKGYYHIFYQYHPESVKWGPMHWGHARSRDLVHWEQLPIALFPGDAEDPDGCFSGSAIEKDGRLYLMYTGQHLKDNDPEQYWEPQNLAVSDDGIHFEKYAGNPVIATPPEDNARDFRDPKVWFDGQTYFVVIGSKDQAGLGRVLLYQSKDLIDWDYIGPIATAKSVDEEGYVWECPDFFNMADQDVLIMSPQGIKANGLKYRNFHQTGYLTGHYDEANQKFEHGAFRELDHGHDFYATQTTVVPDGRRILFGWLAMWESIMPEQADGWAGALTFPREITVKGDKVLMTPVREVAQLRETCLLDTTGTNNFQAPTKSIEYLSNFASQQNVGLKVIDVSNQVLIDLQYDAQAKTVALQKYNDDQPRIATVEVTNQFDIHCLIDTSSIEIFVNNGEACFSERIYSENDIRIETDSVSEKDTVRIYQLGGMM